MMIQTLLTIQHDGDNDDNNDDDEGDNNNGNTNKPITCTHIHAQFFKCI